MSTYCYYLMDALMLNILLDNIVVRSINQIDQFLLSPTAQ